MLYAFCHLLIQITVRWYTILGTSPGGIAAQIVVLFMTELQGGWWRAKTWRTVWKGGLKRALFALAAVWILTFAVCAVTTVYDDHNSLAAANEALRQENEALKNPTAKADDPEKQKRLAIRTELGKLLDLNINLREECMNANHAAGFSCMGEYLRWRARTWKYVSIQMEPQYLSRFKATMGTAAMYKSSSGSFLIGDDADAMNLLTFSGTTLDEFIREFQN
jgi:hypothetical protein